MLFRSSFIVPARARNDGDAASRNVPHDDVPHDDVLQDDLLQDGGKPERARCESQAGQMPASRSWESPKRSSSSPPQSMRLRNRLHMRRFGAFR